MLNLKLKIFIVYIVFFLIGLGFFIALPNLDLDLGYIIAISVVYLVAFIKALDMVLESFKKPLDSYLNTISASWFLDENKRIIPQEVKKISALYAIVHKHNETLSVFKSFLDNSSDTFLLSDEKGKILLASVSCKDTFGYSQQEMIGINVDRVLCSDFFKTDVIYPNEEENKCELCCTTKTKNSIKISVCRRRLVVNNTPFVLFVISDLTSIENRKNLINMSAHSIKTPLTSISGALNLLVANVYGDLSDKSIELVKIANNNMDLLRHLLRDIEDVASLQLSSKELESKEHLLTDILAEVVTMNRFFADEFNVKLKFNPTSEQIVVKTDVARFEQVLTNLISNAVRCTPKNASITVSFDRVGKNARIYVSDEGTGIPQRYHALIFEKPLAENAGITGVGGTGIVLMMSKILVQKMGGTIGFATKEGQGTTFYFDIPLLR